MPTTKPYPEKQSRSYVEGSFEMSSNKPDLTSNYFEISTNKTY
jgi:hypothetical protein